MINLATASVPIKKDVAAGCIILAFALGFGIIASSYSFGNASRMGPGFFPIILSWILGLLGLAVAVKGLRDAGETMVFVAPVRLLCVVAAPLALGLLVRPLGFLVAVAVTTFIGTLAAPMMKFRTRFIVAGGMAVLTTLVFIKGLGLPLPVFGRLLTL